LIAELARIFHQQSKLYLSVPASNPEFDYAYLSTLADGLILMNYDQHYPGGAPGAIAGQDWFTQNLVKALKLIPVAKNHLRHRQLRIRLTTDAKGKPGMAGVHNVSVQEAWLEARATQKQILILIRTC